MNGNEQYLLPVFFGLFRVSKHSIQEVDHSILHRGEQHGRDLLERVSRRTCSYDQIGDGSEYLFGLLSQSQTKLVLNGAEQNLME